MQKIRLIFRFVRAMVISLSAMFAVIVGLFVIGNMDTPAGVFVHTYIPVIAFSLSVLTTWLCMRLYRK